MEVTHHNCPSQFVGNKIFRKEVCVLRNLGRSGGGVPRLAHDEPLESGPSPANRRELAEGRDRDDQHRIVRKQLRDLVVGV